MSNNNDNNGFFSVFSSNGSGGGGGSTSGKGIHALGVTSGIRLSGNILYPTLTTLLNNKTAMLVYPFYPANNFTISRFRFEVTTAVASSTANVVMYDDLNGLPNNKIYESSAISTATTGLKTIIVNYVFTKGTTYYIGVYSGSSVVISALPLQSTYSLGFSDSLGDFFNGYSGNANLGIPNPFGTATQYSGQIPYVSMLVV